MSSKPFVHLHTHSKYSLLDGLSDIPDLARKAVEHGSPALTITDHGTVGGLMQLSKACKAEGIKPIYGVEFYHAKDRRVKRRTRNEKANNHLTALATSTTGYRNLLALSAIANKEGKYGKWPRVDDEVLSQYSDGLVLTSGCMGSMVSQHLMNGDYQAARKQAAAHRDMVGKDRYYVEIMRHGFAEQDKLIGEQLRLAKDLGLGLVATNDSHYTEEGDSVGHDVLLCVQMKTKINDPNRMRFESDQFYFKSPREMWELFPEDEFPGACENTLKIAGMVDDDIQVSTTDHLLPGFPIPDNEAGRAALDEAKAKGESPSDVYLRNMVVANARREKFYGDSSGRISEKVAERIDYELSVISDMGFSDYFLILADIVQWAKSHGILVGPARGSAAGSIVAYLTKITAVDPLEFDLMFERFLNPARREMPDIDVDFDPARAHEVIAYTREFYGEDNVALIGTYQYVKAKNAIRDAARVLDYPPAVGDRISKQIPDSFGAKWKGSLRDMLEEPSDYIVSHDDQMEMWREVQELRDNRESRREDNDILDKAMMIEGTVKTVGEHPAGVLIAPGAVWNYTPVRARKSVKQDEPNGDMLVSEYDMEDIVATGLVKYDFLKIKNLPAIKRTIDLVERDTGKKIKLDEIPFDDPKVFDMLGRGKTDGVFQLESEGCTRFVADLKPKNFAHLYAVLAIYRPGPLGADMHKSFARRVNGKEKPTYIEDSLHKMMTRRQREALAPILDETLGLLCYQEQVMKISQVVAGYDMSEADNFRKIIGKKKLDLLEGLHDDFVSRSVENGFDERFVKRLWEIILPFSSYCFNKSHAVGYGMVSYWTAWLKANYPEQFSAACIDFLSEDRRPAQVNSAIDLGVEVLPPNINTSEGGSVTSPGRVWIGLHTVKGLGSSGVNAIVDERVKGGDFKSLYNFVTRIAKHGGVSQTNIEKLIKCGALDTLHPSRCEMVQYLPDMWEDAQRGKKHLDLGMGLLSSEDITNTDEMQYTLDGRIKDWSAKEQRLYEMEVLGFTVGEHPCAGLKDKLPSGVVMADSARLGDKQVAGLLMDLATKPTAKGGNYSKFTLSTDMGGALSCIAFDSVDMQLNGEVVIVSGEVEQDTFSDDENAVILKVRNVERFEGDGEPSVRSRAGSRRAPKEKKAGRASSSGDERHARVRPARRRGSEKSAGNARAQGKKAQRDFVVDVASAEDMVAALAVLLEVGDVEHGCSVTVTCGGANPIELPLLVNMNKDELLKLIPVARITTV